MNAELGCNLHEGLLLSSPYLQISGDQLKTTNLKSLGLTRGKAAFKLLVRSTGAVKEQAFVEALNLKKPSDVENQTPNLVQEITASPRIEPEELIEPTSRVQPQEPAATQHIETLDLSSRPTQVDDLIVGQDKDNQNKQSSSDLQEMEIESEESSDEGEEVIHFVSNIILLICDQTYAK